MEIKQLHSFLVHPDKGSEEQTQINGTVIAKSGKMYKMLHEIFHEAHEVCKYDIAFLHASNGEQKNDCRDLIVRYAKTGRFENAKKLAARLQATTTKRSGLGLFFLILGKQDAKRRLVLSRFPADNGIVAEEKQQKLTVEFVERIFMKNAFAYKSACYEGQSFDADFWKGKVIDKQNTSDLTISDYWIKEFLLSDFATSGSRGTRRLAAAFRDAVNKSKSIEIKEEITSVLRLARNFNGKPVSASSLSQRMGLGKEACDAIKAEMNEALFEEQFILLTEELDKLIAFKTIELDNGAFLSAETKKFGDVFQQQKAVDGNVSFSTVGKIVDEKVRKRK